MSTDRIKSLVAVVGSQKKFRRWVSEQSTYLQQFLASSLAYIYITAGLKVGFIKLPLKQAGQGQKGLKGWTCCQAAIVFN